MFLQWTTGINWLELRIKRKPILTIVTILREFQTLWKSWFSAMFLYTLIKPFGKRSCLSLSKEQKEQRVRSHFRFWSMLYFIWVKLVYSNLEERNVTTKIQKIPGYKDGVARNMPLWRHKGRSVKILYIENYLPLRVGAYLILSGRYIFFKRF